MNFVIILVIMTAVTKNTMLYDTTLGKVMRIYLVDVNIITVKTVWRAEWPECYKPLKMFEIIQYIKNFGREASSLTYATMNKELFKMLDAYNDTHKTQLNVQINSVDFYQHSEVHMTLYHTRRVGDRNRSDKIITWSVNVVNKKVGLMPHLLNQDRLLR